MTISPARIAVIPASHRDFLRAKAGIHWTAALLAATLLLAAAPAAAEELGRLFFTPERRAALERQRQLNIQEAQQQLIEGATLSVSGVVQRSGGKTITWVNGAPQESMNPATGVRVEVDRANPGRATVVAGEEEPASLKVGEAINRATRETTTGVGDGRITVKRESARTK